MSDQVEDVLTSDLRVKYQLPTPLSDHTMVIFSNKFGPGHSGLALVMHAPNQFNLLVMPDAVDWRENHFKDGHPFSQRVWAVGFEEQDLGWAIYWITNSQVDEVTAYLQAQGYLDWIIRDEPWQELLIRSLFMGLDPRYMEGMTINARDLGSGILGDPARFSA